MEPWVSRALGEARSTEVKAAKSVTADGTQWERQQIQGTSAPKALWGLLHRRFPTMSFAKDPTLPRWPALRG